MKEETELLLAEVLAESKKRTNWWPLISIVLIFILLWMMNGWVLLDHTNEERGSIGDMFGASNALFSGLALAAVAYSLWLQRSELELQRKVTLASVLELRESVEAQKGSEQAQRAQADAIILQVQALNEQNEIIDIQTKEMAYQTIALENQSKAISSQVAALEKQDASTRLQTRLDAYAVLFNYPENRFIIQEPLKSTLRKNIIDIIDLLEKE